MGSVVTTMTVIVVANAILLPLAAYGCMRLGVLPGVRWYWPLRRHHDGPGPMVRTVDGFSAAKGYGFIDPYDEATSAALERLQAAARIGGDTLMESADGKLFLIPFPLEPFEIRDQEEITELRREAQRVPPRDVTTVRSLAASNSRTSGLLRAWLRGA